MATQFPSPHLLCCFSWASWLYVYLTLVSKAGLPWWLNGKESSCQCRRQGFDPWVEKIPWRREWQPTPVFLPGESHGQRSLTGYSPWGYKRVEHIVTKQQFKPAENLLSQDSPSPLLAAAKSLQSCPTLCNPIDGSPSGSPVSGILQARTLEWVAISFSNAWKWKVKGKSLSCVWLWETP